MEWNSFYSKILIFFHVEKLHVIVKVFTIIIPIQNSKILFLEFCHFIFKPNHLITFICNFILSQKLHLSFSLTIPSYQFAFVYFSSSLPVSLYSLQFFLYIRIYYTHIYCICVCVYIYTQTHTVHISTFLQESISFLWGFFLTQCSIMVNILDQFLEGKGPDWYLKNNCGPLWNTWPGDQLSGG